MFLLFRNASLRKLSNDKEDEINNSTEIRKSKKKTIKILKEKDEENINFLNKKRKRCNIKRGSNCSWTVEEVNNKNK